MVETFWTNTIWYILLGFITLVEIFIAMLKVRRKGSIFAFYLTILGITLNFETIILIYLRAYTYYPMIVKNSPNPFDDVFAGNIFSQTSVAATALLFIVFNLKFYWAFIFSGIYGLTELLFLSLDIYTHNWYRTWMTVLLIPVFIWIAKKMYVKINQGVKPLPYYLHIYLALFPLNIVILTWGVLILFKIMDYSTTLLTNPLWSRHFLILVHFWILVIPIMFIYFYRVKKVWKFIIIIVLYLISFLGYKLNLIIIKDGWFFVASTISIFWQYFSVYVMDKLYRGLKGDPRVKKNLEK